MRLTKAFATDGNGKAINYAAFPIGDNKVRYEICQKLGRLEDIEEEIGIDLITLFKALKDGIWHITSNGKVIGYLNVKWNWCIGRDYFKTKYGNFYFKDYGKTWALTKEELE